MKRGNKSAKKRVLIIVAHPDDETIWMGGTILKNKKNWSTTIISLCRKNDKDRAPKFKRVCKALKAKCYISDLEDEKLGDLDRQEIVKRVRKFVDSYYDYIFTHGKNGEYGHRRHKDINLAVREMLKKKILSCKKLFFFSYAKRGKFCYPNKNSDKFIKLGHIIFIEKKDLIQKFYGFKKKSFEEKCCRNIESFKSKRLI